MIYNHYDVYIYYYYNVNWNNVYEWFYQNIELEMRPIVSYASNGNWIIHFKTEEDKVKFILWL